MWEDSVSAEGWALYAEGLMAEPQPGAPHGFYSPEEHLYQLQGELFRDLRVRIDTAIHTGRHVIRRCRDPVLRGRRFHSRLLPRPEGAGRCGASAPAARARAVKSKRYARWPTQAITYRLGKEQILSLRHRAQRLFGPEFSEQRFHLEFMKQGTIPTGYFAEELLRELGRPAS